MSFELVKLGEVAKFIRGVSYKPNDLVENFSENSIVCMRTANVQKKLDETDMLSIPLTIVKDKTKYLQEGDILVSTANSWNLVGKCSWIPKLEYLATAGGFISILRADDKKIDRRYLYHWFNSDRTQIQARNCGRQTTNISNMDLDRALSLKIPLPPLSEQKRIAQILDKADELRQKRQQSIDKLNELLQACFLKIFENEKCSMSQIKDLLENGKSIRTGPFGSQLLHSEFVDEGIAVLGIDNAVKNTFKWAKPRFITPEKYEQLKRYTVKPKDVIITIMGTCGKCAVVPDKIPLSINTKHLCCITLDFDKCNPEFLHSYFLLHPTSINFLKSRAKGAIMAGLNMSIIKDLPVELPSIEIQNEFAELKTKIGLQKSKLINQLQEQDNLFQSLQQRAFNGEL